MSYPVYPRPLDEAVRVHFQAELAALGDRRSPPPHIAQVLWPRFARHYERLRAMPRRTRRGLERQWKRSLAALALLLALGQAPALAATITVRPNTPPAIRADGRCSLIEAIVNANSDARTHQDCRAGSGADTLVLPVGSVQTLTAVHNTAFGATGLPVIRSAITIAGNNSTIVRASTAPNFRILAVGRTGNLTLQQTTVSGGLSGDDGAGMANFGGIVTLTHSTVSGNRAGSNRYGGGVYNRGTLVLTDSTVSGNTTGPYGGGAGLVNRGGTLTLTNSTVTGNRNYLPYGGRYPSGIGGGVFSSGGTVTLTDSTVSGNSARTGGGIEHRGGTLILTHSTVSNNGADFGAGVSTGGIARMTRSTIYGNSAYTGLGGGSGGGVANGGTLTLANSTVSGNEAGGYSYGGCCCSGAGGGVFNGSSGILTLVNSTVSDNRALCYDDGAAYGGGVWNQGSLTATHSTVSGNTASCYGGSDCNAGTSYGGGVFNFNGTLNLTHTLISGNTAPTGPEIDASGTVVVNGFNLFGHDGSAGLVGFSPGPTDIVPRVPVNAILLPLADNGGATFTHALAMNSPALDAAPVGPRCPPTDQRREARPQGTRCDIGAFEGSAVLCAGQVTTQVGTHRQDWLTGTPESDVIAGLSGNDVIRGRAGDDVLCGDAGEDTLRGGDGADLLLGGLGDDRLFGQRHADRLLGQGGDDALDGGGGTDECDGGPNTLGGDTALDCEAVINVP